MKICLRLKEVAEVLRFCRAVKPSGSVAHVLAQFPPPVNNSGGLRLRSGVPKRARAFVADLGRATPSNTINMFKFDRDKGLAGGVIHYKGAVTVA